MHKAQADQRADLALLGALRGRDELPARVRLRISLDVMEDLRDRGGRLDPRSDASGLRLNSVRIGPTGAGRLGPDLGDASGAALLLWELLASREAPVEVPRVHDVVDEIHPDVDDLVARALEGGFASVEELAETLAGLTSDVASHEEVLAAILAPPASQAAARPPSIMPRPSVPWPRAPSVPPPAPTPESAPSADPLREPGANDAPRIDARDSDPSCEGAFEEPRSSPGETPLILLFLAREDDRVAEALRREGFLVMMQTNTQEGYEAAALTRPRVIVCDSELEGSYELIEQLRLSTEIRTTPLLLLTPPKAERTSAAGFFGTADVCMHKPYRCDEMVGQVSALVRMRARLRRDPRRTSALRGDLTQVSVGTVLQILDLEQRSGIFTVKTAAAHIALEISSGHAVRGNQGGVECSAEEALRAMMRERDGHFAFMPLAPSTPPTGTERVGRLLLDTARQVDEEIHFGASAAGQR